MKIAHLYSSPSSLPEKRDCKKVLYLSMEMGLSLLTIYSYLYTLLGSLQMGGVYLELKEFTLRLVLPLPSLWLAAVLLKQDFSLLIKIIFAPSTRGNPMPSDTMKTLRLISYLYMGVLALCFVVFGVIFVQKFNHTSFYYVTVWYIYFFGLLNFCAPILLSGWFLAFNPKSQ